MVKPLYRLTKKEILWLANNKCGHRKNYLEHPACNKKSDEERIGFLDIESTNLNATYGFILSYCLKERGGKIKHYLVSPKEIHTFVFDKNLLKQLIEDLKGFDRIITYYGGDFRFDFPMIRTRAVGYGLKFPHYKSFISEDLYSTIKKKFKFHSNRLQVACEFFGIKAKTHPLTPQVWARALAGHTPSLKYILTHNKEDVIATEKLWERVREYNSSSNASI